MKPEHAIIKREIADGTYETRERVNGTAAIIDRVLKMTPQARESYRRITIAKAVSEVPHT